MSIKTRVAHLLEEHSRRTISDPAQPAAATGAAIRPILEFVVRVGFLTMDEALDAVRLGLGEAFDTYPEAFIWATDEFQEKMDWVMANSFGRNPRYPFNLEIVQHDDPKDRVRAWCEAQGRIFITAYETYDHLKARHPDRHSGTREENLERLIASARAQVLFAVELELITVAEALRCMLRAVYEDFDRTVEPVAHLSGEELQRVQTLVEAGFQVGR